VQKPRVWGLGTGCEKASRKPIAGPRDLWTDSAPGFIVYRPHKEPCEAHENGPAKSYRWRRVGDMSQSATQQELDTFPRLLANHAKVRPEHPAVREKDLGIWQNFTWREAQEQVRALACGLAFAAAYLLLSSALGGLPAGWLDPRVLTFVRKYGLYR